jgi:hypothetical protein
MTATNAIDPSLPPQASDLPPELSALIEAAIARAAGRTTPTAPTVYRSVPEASSLRLPQLTKPKKRTRIIAPGDLVCVGCFVGFLLAAWVSLLIGINMAEAGQRTTRACTTQTAEAAVSRPALDRTLCNRLPQRS